MSRTYACVESRLLLQPRAAYNSGRAGWPGAIYKRHIDDRDHRYRGTGGRRSARAGTIYGVAGRIRFVLPLHVAFASFSFLRHVGGA